MLRREKTKIASLVLSAVMIVLLFVDVPFECVGLYRHGCNIWELSYGRLTYHFFHANFLHLFFNLWCFLSCIFFADVSPKRLFAAWIIACSVPVISVVPTVGLSGVCCALLGFIMWQSHNRAAFNVNVILCLAVPAIIMPDVVNSLFHIYCYFTAALAEWVYRFFSSDKN